MLPPLTSELNKQALLEGLLCLLPYEAATPDEDAAGRLALQADALQAVDGIVGGTGCGLHVSYTRAYGGIIELPQHVAVGSYGRRHAKLGKGFATGDDGSAVGAIETYAAVTIAESVGELIVGGVGD